MKNFKIEPILSITTGILLCPFDEMHDLGNFLMGRETWAHEYADKEFAEILKAALVAQFPELCGSKIVQSIAEMFKDKNHLGLEIKNDKN